MFGETNQFDKFWSDGDIDSIWNIGPVHTLMPSLDLVGHQDIEERGGGRRDGSTARRREGLLQVHAGRRRGHVHDVRTDGHAVRLRRPERYPDSILWSAFSGAPTPTMVSSWSSMVEMEATTMTSIIQGKEAWIAASTNSWTIGIAWRQAGRRRGRRAAIRSDSACRDREERKERPCLNDTETGGAPLHLMLLPVSYCC